MIRVCLVDDQTLVRQGVKSLLELADGRRERARTVLLTTGTAQTAPPFIPAQVGSGLTDWTVIAAGTFLFLLPVAIFTFLLRNHLLRGMSFGAIRK